MNQAQSFSVAGWALRSVAGVSGRFSIWLPFLLVGCVQGLAILIFTQFHNSAISAVGMPLVKLAGGEDALHYPVHYYLLPTMFFKANLVISALVTSVASGAATMMFARAYGFRAERGAWAQALRKAPNLIAITIVVVGILYGISWLIGLIPQSLLTGNTVVRWGIRALMLGVLVVIQSLAAYTTAWVMLLGHNLGPALRDSARVTVKTFSPTLILVAVPALLLYPFSYLATRLDLVAGKLSPEVLVGLLSGQIVIQILVTFCLIGAITRLFLWRVETA